MDQMLTDDRIGRNYKDLCCVFCGYKPGLMVGRLGFIIINGHHCWCCLPCETATIPQLTEEEDGQ